MSVVRFLCCHCAGCHFPHALSSSPTVRRCGPAASAQPASTQHHFSGAPQILKLKSAPLYQAPRQIAVPGMLANHRPSHAISYQRFYRPLADLQVFNCLSRPRPRFFGHRPAKLLRQSSSSLERRNATSPGCGDQAGIAAPAHAHHTSILSRPSSSWSPRIFAWMLHVL
jgi:hypothetical protein